MNKYLIGTPLCILTFVVLFMFLFIKNREARYSECFELCFPNSGYYDRSGNTCVCDLNKVQR